MLEVGNILVATNDCKMNDGSGFALIIGKEYEVNYWCDKKEEMSVESELFKHHFFSTDQKSKSYYGNYFNTTTK